LFEGFFFNVNCFKGYERVKLWARLLWTVEFERKLFQGLWTG
jgi:hypothetical protein